jgi:hypothetical protein
MKPDGFGILSEFFKNSADVFFSVKIPTGKKNEDQKVQSAAYIIFHSIFGIFQLFWSDFFFQKSRRQQ